jgi:Ca-activated chloride channel family protein
MSFAHPLVLLALLGIPALGALYLAEGRRRAAAAAAFVTAPLLGSVAPRRPGPRRHVPVLLFALALAALILAAARPQRAESIPVTGGAVMLDDDVSSSMASRDVTPSRLAAAERAAARFTRSVPSALRVGLLEFNASPAVLQSPTTDHPLVLRALGALRTGGHTAIGTALEASTRILTGLRTQSGRRIPAAIVLISDGGSTTGADPIAAARAAARDHIAVYTVSVGTARGTIQVRNGRRSQTQPVPLDPTELRAIAHASGGRSFTAGDTSHLSDVYAHLAAQLGRKRVERQITQTFAGVGLALLLVGGAGSLRWFARLA